jgi:DNA primase
VQPIPEETIVRIQESSDIVHLISGYVNLKKSGQNFQGLCPFHSEKTPSFSVSPSKQIFHCFGCGTGGNIFKFLMLKEGLSFPDAVKELGKAAGIAVSSGGEGEQDSDRGLIHINETARSYFHQVLLNDSEAAAARDYLKKRGISEETVRKFSIGYSPNGWHHCLDFLEKKGLSPAEIEKAGLTRRRESGEGYYDRFRGRLIFPVSNLQGKCVAFAGRVLDQSLPKYLNSPESPVYQKGKILYALDKVKNEKEAFDFLIVVEGYFDAIRADQGGVRNVVATCGTALTRYHLQLIRRMVRKVYLIFDPDPAGINAALRTVDLFIESGIQAFVVVLPEGLDPDLFIHRYGKEAFDRSLETAAPLFDFVLKQSIQKNAASGIEGKLAVIKELLPLVGRISNRVENSYYLNRIAGELSVSEKDLWEEFQKIQIKEPPSGKKGAGPAPLEKLPLEEEYVIRFLLSGKIAPVRIFQYIEPSDFTDPRAGRIMEMLLQRHSAEAHLDFRKFFEYFSGDNALTELMTLLSLKEPDYDYPDQALEESLNKLIRNRKIRLRAELEKKIPLAEQQKNHEQVAEISRMILKIQADLNERVKL